MTRGLGLLLSRSTSPDRRKFPEKPYRTRAVFSLNIRVENVKIKLIKRTRLSTRKAGESIE
jgi:hypothetical protein